MGVYLILLQRFTATVTTEKDHGYYRFDWIFYTRLLLLSARGRDARELRVDCAERGGMMFDVPLY